MKTIQLKNLNEAIEEAANIQRDVIKSNLEKDTIADSVEASNPVYADAVRQSAKSRTQTKENMREAERVRDEYVEEENKSVIEAQKAAGKSVLKESLFEDWDANSTSNVSDDETKLQNYFEGVGEGDGWVEMNKVLDDFSYYLPEDEQIDFISEDFVKDWIEQHPEYKLKDFNGITVIVTDTAPADSEIKSALGIEDTFEKFDISKIPVSEDNKVFLESVKSQHKEEAFNRLANNLYPEGMSKDNVKELLTESGWLKQELNME